MHDSIFNKEIKNLEEEIAKLKCVNDKYLDIIQAKNMNESFLESEIVSPKKQLEKSTEMIGHVVYDYERLISSKVDKIETLEQELQKTRERLEIAEKVIEFYADGDNYGHISPEIATYSVIDVSDLGAGDFMLNDSVDDERVGGKRARQYLKDKQGE